MASEALCGGLALRVSASPAGHLIHSGCTDLPVSPTSGCPLRASVQAVPPARTLFLAGLLPHLTWYASNHLFHPTLPRSLAQQHPCWRITLPC